MKILNYGSLNYDHIYLVDHIVRPGETLSSSEISVRAGGKGLNLSIGLGRVGMEIYHGGMAGEDGTELLGILREHGVHTEHISIHAVRSGHAVIQVDGQGENSILLYQGANGKNSVEKIKKVLSCFSEGDVLLLQNEINLLRELMEIACEKGMKVVLNPSPMNENVTSCDLSRVSLFILNELEAGQLVGETEPEQMIAAMRVKYPEAATVLTLGKAGSIYADGERVCRCPCFPVEAVDTTAAGDTFAGYYLTAMLCGREVGECLRTASAASALAVTKRGAAPSIPYYKDVEEFLRSR